LHLVAFRQVCLFEGLFILSFLKIARFLEKDLASWDSSSHLA
jgi:hypothetical protein